MGRYKKIGLSHEMGLIDTPPLLFFKLVDKILHFKLFLISITSSLFFHTYRNEKQVWMKGQIRKRLYLK